MLMVKTEVFLQAFVPKALTTKPMDLLSLLGVSQAWGGGCGIDTSLE